jgi:hydrogenase expression/formation protein HypC
MGVPYEIVRSGYPMARGKSRHEECDIDMSLVGDVPIGTHVLTFLGAAREVVGADQARQIADALEALRLILAGDGNIDHLFADLAHREPQLPEHLRAGSSLDDGS